MLERKQCLGQNHILLMSSRGRCSGQTANVDHETLMLMDFALRCLQEEKQKDQMDSTTVLDVNIVQMKLRVHIVAL